MLNWQKIWFEISFLPFSQVWFNSFPLNYIDDFSEQCLSTSRSKTQEKIPGAQN